MSTPFVHHRRILFGDCDPGGIIYTPRVSHFVVEAGLAFMSEKLGGSPERKLFEMGVAPPARKLSMEFLSAMTWDDELLVAVELKEIRQHAIVLSFEGTVSEKKTFTAELTMVCVSKDTFKKAPVPDKLRHALSA